MNFIFSGVEMEKEFGGVYMETKPFWLYQDDLVCLDTCPESILDELASSYLTDNQWDENYQGMILFDKREYLISVLKDKQALLSN